jgi:fumarate hydratase class II
MRGVLKTGRTHLQDAVPVTLGQVFSGYARQIELGLNRLDQAGAGLLELPLGGTAVGSGINTHPEFAARVIAGLADDTGIDLKEAANHFEAQAAKDACVQASGALKTIAISLAKVANDLRLLASGPRFGYGEINLPVLQPGSSIMPGKINPVIPEVVVQVSAQVMGNDLAISLGGLGGYFELNTMMPLIARNLLESIDLLAAASEQFAQNCISGITPNVEKAASTVEGNLSLATFLAPAIGYDKAAELAHQVLETGRTVRELALEQNLLDEAELDRLLGDPANEK